MKTKLLLLSSALACASLAQAQAPSITNVTNAASYAAKGLPGSGIAQGSIFSIFGSNLGPATLVQAGAPRPTAAGLAGTRVRITVSGTNYDAPMIFTASKQVAAIMPSNVPLTAQANVVVLVNDTPSAPFPVAVVRYAPGIYTLNSAGTGPGVVTDPNYTAVTFTTALNPGGAGVIWMNGLGGTTASEDINGAAGAIPNLAQVEVFVGGKTAPVLYAGRTPGFTGLDQVNFTVPDGVEGCAVPLVIRQNGGTGVVSNFVSISVARTGRTCRDRGFTEADFQSAASGRMRLGALSLGRTSIKSSAGGFDMLTRMDIGSGTFFSFDYNALIRSSSVAEPPSGACTVSTFGGDSEPADPALALFTPLDAGNSIGVNGPNGPKTLDRQSGLENRGSYYAKLGGGITISGLPGGIPGLPGGNNLPDYLSAGTYTLTGTGGADVGAFTATLNYPQPLTWTNEAAITNVNRTQNLSITWSGGASNDLVVITGTSTNTNPTVGGSFICYSTAAAGGFTVPSWVLSALPVSSVIEGSPTGMLMVGSTSSEPSRFNASGIDIGVVSYFNYGGKSVNFQ